jgi:hypothetical protein
MRRLVFLTLIAAACSESTGPESPLPLSPEAVVTSARTGEITLSWRDVSQNETTYRVELLDASGNWVLLRETAANATSVVHTGVTHNVTYHYRVAACNANGCSAWIEALGKWQSATAPMLTLITVNTLRATSANLVATGLSGGQTTHFVFTLTKAGNPTIIFQSERLEGFYTGPETENGRPVTASFAYHALEPATDYVLNVSASNIIGTAPAIAPFSFRTPAS